MIGFVFCRCLDDPGRTSLCESWKDLFEWEEARLFGPALLEAKLKVLFVGADKGPPPDELPRIYTLTHCDITSKLRLAISREINKAQLQAMLGPRSTRAWASSPRRPYATSLPTTSCTSSGARQPPPMALQPHDVIHFASRDGFRAWLAEHHADRDELWVGFWKKDTGKQTMTWSESVDQALCFGWIDGVRKPIGEGESAQRFTPRRAGSNWSTVNINKVAELTAAGLMEPAGVAAFEARTEDRSSVYSYERRYEAVFTTEQQRTFQAEAESWAFWEQQPPGYKANATHWVVSAKREETRTKRMATLIDDCADGLRIKHLRR